jgi:hypothetical protein
MLAGSKTIDANPLTWYFAQKSVVHGLGQGLSALEQAVSDREEA